jgi:ABC transporter related
MIEVEHITKEYKVAKREAGFHNAVKALFSRKQDTVRALNDISFKIDDGEILAYIGPNGAGKSTTIKILCGILTPDKGNCIVDGYVPWKDRKSYVKNIGVVFGQRSQLWWDIPIIDSFELIKEMYDIDSRTFQQNVSELCQLLDLEKIVQTPARNLSLGQRMRCEIVASLLHNPKILFLDEPTIGLDAVSKLAVRDFIKRINTEKGTTVILTTHDMQDIEALTHRVMLIGNGQILLDGSLEELKKRVSDKKEIIIKHSGKTPTLCEGMNYLEQKDDKLKISLDPKMISVSEGIAYLSRETELIDLEVSDISAEEMVARLYKEYQI